MTCVSKKVCVCRFGALSKRGCTIPHPRTPSLIGTAPTSPLPCLAHSHTLPLPLLSAYIRSIPPARPPACPLACSLSEWQLKDYLFGLPGPHPAVLGKVDEAGNPLLPQDAQLQPTALAVEIARVRFPRFSFHAIAIGFSAVWRYPGQAVEPVRYFWSRSGLLRQEWVAGTLPFFGPVWWGLGYVWGTWSTRYPTAHSKHSNVEKRSLRAPTRPYYTLASPVARGGFFI